jgi:alpha-D-ribose 1-methylphosphonate 5-triphosphate synthase subunit PhnH
VTTFLDVRFADPVLDSQRVFRALMDALSRPGSAQRLQFAGRPPLPLTAELAAVTLTLADQDAPVWLDPALSAEPEVSDWLAFQTGATIARDPGQAAFALATGAEVLVPLSRFAGGTDEYPDRSTTVVLQVGSFDGGPPLRLKGPGVDGSTTIAPVGLPEDFADQWSANRAMFPRGVDVLLVAPGAVIGLPRTTRLEA